MVTELSLEMFVNLFHFVKLFKQIIDSLFECHDVGNLVAQFDFPQGHFTSQFGNFKRLILYLLIFDILCIFKFLSDGLLLLQLECCSLVQHFELETLLLAAVEFLHVDAFLN